MSPPIVSSLKRVIVTQPSAPACYVAVYFYVPSCDIDKCDVVLQSPSSYCTCGVDSNIGPTCCACVAPSFCF